MILIAIALWFLSTNFDYRTIGRLFGVSKATVCIVTKEVCPLIVDTLFPKYIRIPNGDSLKQVVQGFNDKGFPQCVGALDGLHISIVSPHDCPADYFNRKGFHSIILQGVVNHIVYLVVHFIVSLSLVLALGSCPSHVQSRFKIRNHFHNVMLVGMASEISKNYTYKCVDRSRHNGIKGAKAKCAH